MMDLREQFKTVLAEFGDLMNVRLETDEDDGCWMLMDETIEIRLDFDAENDSVRLWSPIGELPPDAAASGLAQGLLALCGDDDVTRGFVVGMDGETRQLAILGMCPATWLYSAGCMAEWLERLNNFYGRVQEVLGPRRTTQG